MFQGNEESLGCRVNIMASEMLFEGSLNPERCTISWAGSSRHYDFPPEQNGLRDLWGDHGGSGGEGGDKAGLELS